MCPNFWFEQASGHEYQAEPIAAVKIAWMSVSMCWQGFAG
jgi:hypothetical protein